MRAMRPAVLVLLVALLAVPLGLVPAAHAGGDTKGGFVVTCRYSHTAQDDPIVYPGQPGAAHSHDFFGNQSTDAASTYQSLVQGQSSCSVPQDTAGYWVPSPYVDGSAIHPTGRVGDLRVYYRSAGAMSVQSIPASLELIGGDKTATAPPALWEVRWYCGAGNAGTTPFSSHPYDCTPYANEYPFVDGVVGIVDMPRCWDGTGLLPTDVVYPMNGSGTACPDGFGALLPLVSERVHFGIMDPCAGATPCGPEDPDTNVRLTVSTGSGVDTSPDGPYFTLHADFWNAWQQDTLDALVGDCLNSHVACDFLGARYGLSVGVMGSAPGTVTSEPAGVSCSTSCSAMFPTATHVTLTATPDTGSIFAGWGGDCTGTDTCTVAMEHAHDVTATFETTATPYRITVARRGSGGGVVTSEPGGIECGRTCTGAFGPGVAVRLHAAPSAGSIFDRWGGACSGTGDCVLHVLSDAQVTATFLPVRYRPDAQIKAAHGWSFSGVGRFGGGGEQRALVKLRRGERGHFIVRLVNDGNVPDRFLLRAPGDRGPFRVWYVAGGSRTGITRSVLSGRYTTNVLLPGASRTLLVLVDVSRAARPGTRAMWLIHAASAGRPSARDAVAARVVVVKH